jgi:hypothetical protein
MFAFRYTPFANSYTLNMAKALINNEHLGEGKATDFLAVSFSAPDYIGHEFGPNSVEIEDCYLRLDRDLADFFQHLDLKYGKNNYVVFLTADHGVLQVPAYLRERKIPAGSYSVRELKSEINKAMEARFGVKALVQQIENCQLYLNAAAIRESGTDENALTKELINWLQAQSFVSRAFELDKNLQTTMPAPLRESFVNAYNSQRSGKIQFVPKNNFIDRVKSGTTHGNWNPYDSHIPLVWMGWGIKKGRTYRETYMTDIAATLAALLRIQMPNGCIGKPIVELLQP